MRYARTRLQVTLPEAVWIGQLSRQYSAARFRILAAFADGDVGVGVAEIHAEDIGPVVDEMGRFETEQPLLLFAARDSGVPLEMPVELADGSVTWTVTAPSGRLSEVGTQLRALGLSFSIEDIQQEVADEQLLTDAQLKVIETAIDAGYYETPRTCSLTELAAQVDRAKSTVSEILHRAESKIITEFVGGSSEDTPGVTRAPRFMYESRRDH